MSDDETLHRLVRLLSHDLLNTAQALFFSATYIEKNWHQGKDVREASIHLVKLAKAQMEMIRRARETYQAHQAQLEIPSRMRPVDLGEAVDVALSLFVEAIRAKDLRVHSSIRRCAHFAEAEPNTLAHQVIANLLSNAIKFTPRGKRIELRVEEEGGTVVLAVADQGIGMKSARTDASDMETESRPGTEGEPGAGFGLLQVRQYVKAFGGRVEVTSHQPGTTFRILLRKASPLADHTCSYVR